MGCNEQPSYVLSMVYAAIMMVNGVGHNVATLVSGRYYGAFAGGYTGIGLLLIGAPMFYCLWKERPAG